MIISAVIIPCSKSKSIQPAPAACAAALPRAEQDRVQEEWLARLRELSPSTLARDLYTGRGFVHGRCAADLAGARLYIASAGLGLVSADCRVPTYGVTVSGSGEDSVRSRVAGKFSVSRWWKAVSRGPYATPLPQVFEQSDGLVVAGLSRPYLQMIAADLDALSDEHVARLRIVGASIEGILSDRFSGCLVHFDAEEVNASVPGTRYDLAQRSLLHFIRRQSARAPAKPSVPLEAPLPATKGRFVFLLDSGAFTAWRSGKKIPLEDYAEFVSENRRLFRGGAFNLDVIGSDRDSYENWLELKRLGAETIPVHHFGDDDAYLKKYLDQSDCIALGGMARMSTHAKVACLDHLWRDSLRSADGSPRCRVHGLGITKPSLMLRYPWYSVDSAQAGIQANSGSIFLPRITSSRCDYANLHSMYVSQRREHAVGNGSSFYSLSPGVRSSIIAFIRTNGFDICEQWVGDNTEIDNLSTSWRHRYSWNLEMISRLVQCHLDKGRSFRIYDSTPCTTANLEVAVKYNSGGLLRIFDSINASSLLEVSMQVKALRVSRILVSYANLISGTAFLKVIKECLNGSTEEAAAPGDRAGLAGGSQEGVIRAGQQDRVRRRSAGGVQRLRADHPPPAWRP